MRGAAAIEKAGSGFLVMQVDSHAGWPALLSCRDGNFPSKFPEKVAVETPRARGVVGHGSSLRISQHLAFDWVRRRIWRGVV